MTETGRPPVFLHVGAPKSGTTYLQERLWQNRQALRRDGFLYPGAHWASHVWATFALRDMDFKGFRDPKARGAWRRMVAEIREWNGPAIIDQELLSGAFPQQIGRAMRDLSFADVHLVYTLRDMARTLPAAWQEWVKNRETEDFATFLAAVRQPSGERPRAGWLFWNLHDAPLVLGKWSRQLAPDHVHVITVPPPGSDPNILWNRFADVLGIDPDRYPEPVGAANASLPAAEATVLRRLNSAIGADEFPWPVYDRVIKHYLAAELGKRRGTGIALQPDDYEWATHWCTDVVKFIADAGYDVRGDLAELMPAEPRGGCDPDHADPVQVADAAVAGMASLVGYITAGGDPQRPDRISELETRVERAERIVREHQQLRPSERIKRCLVELAGQVGWLQRIHATYRKLRGRHSGVPAGEGAH